MSEVLEPFYLSDDPQAVLDAAREVSRLSNGEIQKPETFNPRTSKPERQGLHCAKTFGPVEDHRCLCGYLASHERAGETCPKCAVLCGEKKLRDERWAHIDVPWPLLHPVLAPRIASLLGCGERDLAAVLAFEANLNADGSIAKLTRADIDSERFDRGPDHVRARLEILGSAELLLSTIPVTPAGWRGSRRDAQDVAYARLVNRRNRLLRLIELNAPAIIIENDYRQTQKELARVCNVVRAEITARRSRVPVPRDGQHAELLQAVLERPLDYGVRSVYADWLIEQGDPRGEFITLQLANAEKAAMGRRESELLARHYDEWIAPLGNVVDYVVFRRGFLATCRADKTALPFLGNDIWATVEHLNTDVPELVRQPIMRALSKLTTNARCLVKLCAEAPLPQLKTVVVRTSSVRPKGWHDAVTTESLPNVRELVVLHHSAQRESDWTWFFGTPLALQLTSLTLGMTIDNLDHLAIARWIPIFNTHPKLGRLALSYDKKRLVFELRRTDKGIELDLTTTSSLVEQLSLMQEDTITPAIDRALSRIPSDALARVNAADNRWFGDSLEALAKKLSRRFRGSIDLPEIRVFGQQ